MPIFSDGFTDTTGTCAENHAPDATGASWYTLFQASAQLIVTSNELAINSNAAGTGHTIGAANGPVVNDFEIGVTISNVDTGTASRRSGMLGRLTSIGDYYKAEFLPTGHASNDCTIFKKVGGTKTSIATVDTGLAASDIITFRITNENKVLYKAGACIISTNDNALTGLGLVAFASGRIDANDSSNAGNAYRYDNFTVNEIDTITTYPRQSNIYRM